MSKVYIHEASHGAIELSRRRPLWPSFFSLPRDLAKKPDVTFLVANARYASIHTGGLAVKPQPLSNVWPIVSVAEANGPMQLLSTYSSMFIGILTRSGDTPEKTASRTCAAVVTV